MYGLSHLNIRYSHHSLKARPTSPIKPWLAWRTSATSSGVNSSACAIAGSELSRSPSFMYRTSTFLTKVRLTPLCQDWLA